MYACEGLILVAGTDAKSLEKANYSWCILSSPFAQALGGGYLHWGHLEMMRLTINRRMDPRTTFARWRIFSPYKPITRKGLGQRMGGGKGAIDHYVTPVKYGRLIVEVGGRLELGEVEPILKEVAKKLPFPAKVKISLVAQWCWRLISIFWETNSFYSFFSLLLM